MTGSPDSNQSVSPQMKLSVVVPVYNERATLRIMIARVLALPLDIEMLCVDDGSKDGTVEILGEIEKEYPQVRVFLQPRNMGKGAALRRGIQKQPATLSLFRTRT